MGELIEFNPRKSTRQFEVGKLYANSLLSGIIDDVDLRESFIDRIFEHCVSEYDMLLSDFFSVCDSYRFSQQKKLEIFERLNTDVFRFYSVESHKGVPVKVYFEKREEESESFWTKMSFSWNSFLDRLKVGHV